MKPSEYRSYQDLPPLAGTATFANAMDTGFSIEQCVNRLKRHHWSFRRLHQIFIHRINSEPIYELKMGYSLHAHYCAEHAAAWRKRVSEMREPPLGLDVVPDEALDVFFDEILAAPDTESLLVGVYSHAVPALCEALERHLEETNLLFDHPSVRICRFALIEVYEMAEYGKKCIAQLVDQGRRKALGEWENALQHLLAQAGRLDGTASAEAGPIKKSYSAKPYEFARVPRRDERFFDPYNLGVHAEDFLYNEKYSPEVKTLIIYYKRLREIDVPELMASILAETVGKPWEYTVDMTRQLWDEARHAMMGEVGFVRQGIDWSKFVAINHTTSLALNTELKPLERHAVLYFVEQGLMAKTGKRYEWEVGLASGDPFSAMTQDYDWADEVLHARIGREWFVPGFPSSAAAVNFGDECWSKIFVDWKKYEDQGLTKHSNWWPGLYKEWCRLKGREPDPEMLAFSSRYEGKRADLKEVALSG
jgi:hypothetical protein